MAAGAALIARSSPTRSQGKPMQKHFALAPFVALLGLGLASPASARESAPCGGDIVGVGLIVPLGSAEPAAPLVAEIDNMCAARADVEFNPAAVPQRQSAPARNLSDRDYRMLSDSLAVRLDMESGRMPWRELELRNAASRASWGD